MGVPQNTSRFYTLPPIKLPGKTVFLVCATSVTALVTGTGPGCWQDSPGQEGGSQGAGGAAGVVLAGRQGWQWSSLSAATWDRRPELGTCHSWAPMATLHPDGEGMPPARPRAQAATQTGSSTSAELGSQPPAAHPPSQRSLLEASNVPNLSLGTPFAQSQEAGSQRK